jgi:raffinose/stachyose/melibiose transport system substrate-binding protein
MKATKGCSGYGKWVMLLLLPALLASCGVQSTRTQEPEPDDISISYITSGGNAQTTSIIEELTAKYATDQLHVVFEYEELGSTELPSKLQLLAASNDLPVMFSYPSGKPLLQFIESGAVLDLSDLFDELGIRNKLLPSAVDLLTALVDGKGLYALPLEMNIEGFWYNKKLFAELNIPEPTTWSDMTKAADRFLEAGIQPFALAGKEKWPITRMINAYLIRKIGPDAMQRVDQGQLRLTSPEFVEAAEEIKRMSFKGYFGQEASKVDFKQATDLFLNGKAAMFYSGSWSLRDFDNEERNRIGADQIGFFSIPLVHGGQGKKSEYPVNAGLTASFSKEAYNEQVGQWIKFVFENYGDYASGKGMITGFRVTEAGDATPLNRMIQQKLNSVTKGALWFEALFTTNEQRTAWDNAQLLITGPEYSAVQYMSDLQATIDEQSE